MKGKRIMLILFGIGLLLLVGFSVSRILQRNQPPPVPHQPMPPLASTDNSTPEGAVVGVLNALRDWDLGLAAQWMAHTPENAFSSAYYDILSPTLGRMEYQIGGQKINGERAQVDVSILAVDISSALGSLSADAAVYLTSCILRDDDADWAVFFSRYMEELDMEQMVRVQRDATVHLVEDSGGRWRVDFTSADNRSFYNALTGGLPETIEKLQALAP